jgi:uncharacterized protein (TIGR02453 family)
MATAIATSFTGFTREGVQFLAELAANNDRAWFQPRKADYERLLKRPLEELCVALAAAFAARGLPLVADPVRSPFRIYRDVRFSRDKSPYKTHLGADFPWHEGQGEPVRHGPGAYFHLAPGEIYAGGGLWHPEPARLGAWRRLVDEDPGHVLAAVEDPAFVARFGGLSGEKLARVPAGYPKDHPQAELLRQRDVTFGRRLSDEEAYSPELPSILAETWADAVPVMRLIANLAA